MWGGEGHVVRGMWCGEGHEVFVWCGACGVGVVRDMWCWCRGMRCWCGVGHEVLVKASAVVYV